MIELGWPWALLALPLPLLAWWLARRRAPASGRTQRNLIFAAATSYLALFGLVLWQAFRGQSIAQPDRLTLESFAMWLIATAIAVVVISSKHVTQILNTKEGIS